MAFDDGTQNLIKNVDETLKILHETIQTQTKATTRQSNIMIWLTVFLVIFTAALLFVAVKQIKVMETSTKPYQTDNYKDRSQNNNNVRPNVPKK